MCASVQPVTAGRVDDGCEVQRVSNEFLQRSNHVTEGLAPTAVAENVSDDDDGEQDARKLATLPPHLSTSRHQPAPDGYCQCKDRAVPAGAGDFNTSGRQKAQGQQTAVHKRELGDAVDRRPLANLARDFRAIQRSTTASKTLPRPLRTASVERHGAGWPGSVKYHQPVMCSRYSVSSNAYRVSTPTDLAVLRGQRRTTSRRHRTTPPPPRDGVGREISRVEDAAVTAKRLSDGNAVPHAGVDSDVASDVSDLDQDIVDDLHLAEYASGFMERRVCRSTDALQTSASTDSVDSQPHRHQNDRTSLDRVPVILRRASAQDKSRAGGVPAGTPRSRRAGSYHGSVHHSVTMPDFPSLTTERPPGVANNRSPVGSLKNVLAIIAGRWSRSGRRFSGSKGGDVAAAAGAEDGKTGCASDHGVGFVSRIVARASCRFPKQRSKSGERLGGGASTSVEVMTCAGRVTVTTSAAVSLRHNDMMSAGKTTTIAGDGPCDGDCAAADRQHHVPYIDDSESEYG